MAKYSTNMLAAELAIIHQALFGGNEMSEKGLFAKDHQ